MSKSAPRKTLQLVPSDHSNSVANVVELGVTSRIDSDPQRLLSAALKDNLKNVIIIGETEDGREYYQGSVASGPEVNWMLDRAKMKLLAVVDE